MAVNLETLRICCKNKKSFLIIYDGAETADLPVLVCNDCFNNTTFQKFIKTKYNITKATDLQSILNELGI